MNELKGKRILFFIPGLNVEVNPIMASQILGLARYAARLGAECAIFQLNENRLDRTYELEPHLRIINHATCIVKSNLFNVVRVFRRLANEFVEEIREFKPTHIYTRNCLTCLGVRSVAKEIGAKVIFSVRGPAAEETRLRGGIGNLIRSWIIARYANAAIVGCDVLSTLSYGYKKYLESRYRRPVIGVVPCCVDERFSRRYSKEELDALRRSMGFTPEDRIVVWSGSLSHWQRLDDIVRLMKGVCQIDRKYRVLFLLKKEKELELMCRNLGFDNAFWKSHFCQADEVPRYLQMADIGLNLQRPETLHSRTCSPIKIPEYLSSGLPVFVSSVMGDMPKLVADNAVGCILPDDLNAEEVYRMFEKARTVSPELCRTTAARLFSWEGNRDEIIKMFSSN